MPTAGSVWAPNEVGRGEEVRDRGAGGRGGEGT